MRESDGYHQKSTVILVMPEKYPFSLLRVGAEISSHSLLRIFVVSREAPKKAYRQYSETGRQWQAAKRSVKNGKLFLRRPNIPPDSEQGVHSRDGHATGGTGVLLAGPSRAKTTQITLMLCWFRSHPRDQRRAFVSNSCASASLPHQVWMNRPLLDSSLSAISTSFAGSEMCRFLPAHCTYFKVSI